ncbi:ATP-dependent DNA helicase PIF1 [Ctenocephalides felis]|uniref:ATP-dependent DNA helicase PIF1 n=1 Tax=Ctenocephalides felis TaxID=7515 RepID=UPI000E6E2C5C|nr:ATP-dependent DNA helicase PIF1 [Ctenocephalides felis]
MDQNEVYVTCAVNIEWLNALGSIIRKANYRMATLRLIRNDMRDLLLEITAEKQTTLKLPLKGINVFSKFMSEGKATIKFKESKCTILLSNAPPSTLQIFLRTLFVKLTGNREPMTPKTLREKMLNSNPNKYDEVSPITTADMKKAKSLINSKLPQSSSPCSSFVRKRKLEGENNCNSLPAAKRIYSENDIFDEDLKLNSEQENVLQACLSGRNVFFTGSAGTGKSFLLKKIIQALPPDSTVATASTGVAACLIGGMTLHSFAGMGSGEATLERCVQMATKNASQNWRRCKHLVIDEISMVDGQYFEKIEAVARAVKRNDRPFGGIQLILCGDFLQLPPVIKIDYSKNNFNAQAKDNTHKRFCFQSPAWEKCIQNTYELQMVHRQKDSEFVKILNSIRIGRVTEEISTRLLETGKQVIEQDGILATRLCSHMNDANMINDNKLEQLKGEEQVYEAQDSDIASRKQLDLQTPVSYKLVLKVGAQVMLLKNISVADHLVNGARGVIIRFDETNNLPVVKFKNKKEYVVKHEKFVMKTAAGGILTRKQIPLRLAWAFSIHKSQGLTLDCVEMSLSKVFEAGQAYVALSRCQSLESLRVLDFDAKQVWANVDVLQFYRNFRRQLHSTEFYKLGEKKDKKSAIKSTKALVKSLERKPLVNIC